MDKKPILKWTRPGYRATLVSYLNIWTEKKEKKDNA
jgi:hypothetical protein